jgi:hypothetical protein
MPEYNHGELPQRVEDLLRYLREEFDRLVAFTRAPRTDGAWDDLRFPAQAIGTGSNAPTWNATYGGLEFHNNNDNDIGGVAQMPHAWRQGTNIRPHIHWQVSPGGSLGTAAVVWEFCYTWRNNGEVQGAKTCHTLTVTPTASSTLALMITSFPEIDGTGKNISSIIDFTVSRLAASSLGDTLSGAKANLKEFDIHYLTDSFGSDKEFIK